MDIEYVAALTGLAAVVVSPMVAYASIRHQARSSFLPEMRQAWINNLRDVVAEYSGLMNSLNQARSLGHQTYDDIYPKLQKSMELESKLMLMINPTEADHKKLTDLTTRGRVAVFGVEAAYDPETWNNVWVELIQVTSGVLKREWVRVKDMQ